MNYQPFLEGLIAKLSLQEIINFYESDKLDQTSKAYWLTQLSEKLEKASLSDVSELETGDQKIKEIINRKTILGEMKKICNDNNSLIELLIRFLYETTRFTGAKFEGQIYNELDNPWFHGLYTVGMIKNVKCTNYHCNLSESLAENGFNIISADKSEIKFKWDFNLDNYDINKLHDQWFLDHKMADFDDDDDDDDDDQKHKREIYDKDYVIREFIKILTNAENLLDLKICHEDVILTNRSGENNDHRGSDHCLLKLPFSPEVHLKAPTLRQFIDALYLIKSHKFDKWYELFIDSDWDMGETDKIVVSIKFDHGS